MHELIGPTGRRDHTETYQHRTMDWMHPHWVCAGCDVRVADPNLYAHGSVSYRTVDELAHTARMGLSVVRYREPPRCGRCHGPAELRAVDYHAFHSERGLDLVMRWTDGAAAAERLWWDGAAYTAATELTEDDRDCILDDATIRRAAARLESEGLEAALGDIGEALDDLPGHPALIAFVPLLLDAGYVDFAAQILEAYCEAHPDDEEARALQAELAP